MNNFKLTANNVNLAKGLELSAKAFNLDNLKRDNKIITFTVKDNNNLKTVKELLKGYGKLEANCVSNNTKTLQRIAELETELANLKASLNNNLPKATVKKTKKTKKVSKNIVKELKKHVDFEYVDGKYTVENRQGSYIISKGLDVLGACGSLELAKNEIRLDKTRG